jgi:hypothetical protein
LPPSFCFICKRSKLSCCSFFPIDLSLLAGKFLFFLPISKLSGVLRVNSIS